MPRRKSRIYPQHGNVNSQILDLAKIREKSMCEKAPYRLTMFIADKPVEGEEDNFIHTRPISRDKAYEIVQKHKSNVYLVSEEIQSQIYIGGKPLIGLPELAIAMEIVPLGKPILSFADYKNVKEDLEYFQSLGAHLLNTGIEDAPALGNDASSENKGIITVPDVVIIGSVQDMLLQFEWTHGIPPHVADWINLRFYAMSILSCCYIGRGAPTGVNLFEQANMIAEDTDLLSRFVDAISTSNRALPPFNSKRLPAWQEKILWESRINSHFQKALKQSENFREYFYYPPLIYQDPNMAAVDEEFKVIRDLMRQMIYIYEKGEENNIPDIIWAEAGPHQMCDALDEIGIVSSIDAYLCGVPYEDIIS